MEGYRHLISAESKTYAVTLQFHYHPFCITNNKNREVSTKWFFEKSSKPTIAILFPNAMGGVGKQQIKSDHVEAEDEQNNFPINNRQIFPRLNLCWEPFPFQVPNLSSSPIVIA